ncbi:MAG: radical SAM protein [Spirochaetales bacterium]|nr:radical SAM protein [Spirochaetales bacterium]
MEASRYNIISRIHESDDWFVVNLLSGNADIADHAHIDMINAGIEHDELVQKGYVVDRADEESRYRKAYLGFIESRDTDEIQFFYAPWYSCNFKCSYCYQASYDEKKVVSQEETIRAFYHYIDEEFKTRKKYVTLFGGEPLLPGKTVKDTVTLFLKEAAVNNLDMAVVTNGFHLTEYISVLKQARIREIQVTLDGLAETHNKRRPLHSGEGTFDRIVEGIDHALDAGFPINLRVVIDRDNMEELHELSDFAIQRGWTKNPLFKTQLGRSYELHTCQKESGKLYSRLSMYQELYAEIRKHPQIMEFHKPAYSVSRFLFEQEELPDPLFDSCPGTKTEWAFDYSGKIFSCTATVGKTGEEVGTFYPEKAKNKEAIACWQNRDVLSIPECRECVLQMACGGGCGSVAKNTSGRLNSPDCRPVTGLLEMGMSLYFINNPAEETNVRTD